MKKKLFLFSLMIQISSALFAQEARSEINTIINTWIIPILGLLLVVSFIALILYNLDALRGKNGLSKQDGWLAIGEGMAYVVVAVVAVGAVALIAGKINFSI